MSTLRTSKILPLDGETTVNIQSNGFVLRCFSTTKTDVQTLDGGTTFQAIENFSVSIDPLKASNKFLIIGHIHFATQGFLGHVQLLRNGTAICIGDAASNRVRVTGTTQYAATDDNYFCSNVPLNFLDSPNTTSTVTYSVQGNYYTSGNSYVNRTHSDRDYSFYEARYSSTMTVMEIAG